MWIKGIVNELVNRYGTRDPFEIAGLKNIKVIEYDLHPDILGFYKYIRRNKFIFLNSDLTHEKKVFTISHELGHSELHPRLNTPFLRKKTLLSTDKMEIEANRFAIELLLPDKEVYQYKDTNLTINEVANIYGVPREVAQLKKYKNF